MMCLCSLNITAQIRVPSQQNLSLFSYCIFEVISSSIQYARCVYVFVRMCVCVCVCVSV